MSLFPREGMTSRRAGEDCLSLGFLPDRQAARTGEERSDISLFPSNSG